MIRRHLLLRESLFLLGRGRWHLLTLSRLDDGLTVDQNLSPSCPDDGSPVIQKKFISKSLNKLVSAK